MSVIVQKFGGSSLASDEQVEAIAQRVAMAHRNGDKVVVVVSARGNTTSRLLADAGKLNSNPDNRELDMLLAAGEQASASLVSLTLQGRGIPSVALTGPQAGVRTCDAHLNARIKAVEPDRVLSELEQRKVVVIAGFQGASPAGDITTLGRGGSDTTAVAIAAAVKADRCEIYSDVDGVYTADPRIVDDASHLRVVAHAEMKALAHHGAGVLNERAIDYAIEHGVTIHARRAHGRGGETIVRDEKGPGRSRIVGVACHKGLLRIEFNADVDRERLEARLGELDVFAPELADGDSGVYFVPTGQLADVDGLISDLRKQFDQGLEVSGPLASVSAVGYHAGQDADTSVFAVSALDSSDIQVLDSLRFAHAVTCLVPADQVADATRCFHDRFGITDTGVANVA
ncbi:MAG: aspartate kinase [Wenzhouxiangella sp.]